MMSSLTPEQFFTWTKGVATSLAILGAVAAGSITLLGIETKSSNERAHQELRIERTELIVDVNRRLDILEANQNRQNQMLQCLIWGVEPDKCQAAGRRPNNAE